MKNGVVSQYLISLICRQVEDHSLVVWYDPERHYDALAESLELSKTTVARYWDGFINLRREIDSLLNGLEPPRLVVYVPLDQSQTQHALIELEAAGVVIQPGQQPPQRNTRLAVVARNALKNVLGEDIAAEVEKQVEASKLSLDDLDALAEKGSEISKGVLSLVFGTGNSQEIALDFLISEKCDQEIEKKSATQELSSLLQIAFDIELPGKSLNEIREKLARHVLLTELVQKLGKPMPASLSGVKLAGTPAGIDACLRLADSWRRFRDGRDSYILSAKKVEAGFSIGQLNFDPQKLFAVETFLAIERALIRHVETGMLERSDESLLVLARSRLSGFWAESIPNIQACWALIASAGQVILEADRLAKVLKSAPADSSELVRLYSHGDSPWCLIDTYHRHMESRWYVFDPSGEDEALEKLMVKARQRYVEVGSELAKLFVTHYQKVKGSVDGLLSQRDVFQKHVKSRLGEGKTAYVWVDALRFEMGRELCEVLRNDFELEIYPVLSAIPTITEVGMASLLPDANKGKIVSVGGGKLAVEINGAVIKNRKDRLAFLKEHAGVGVCDVKLEELLPKPGKRVREGVQNCQLILVTSQEIDELCEQDNVPQARRQMDGVLNDLRRGLKVLCDLDVKSLILAADHGHLFAEELSDDMKIDAPGGETVDLHRRVWVGHGGTSEPSYLRASLKSLGVDSEYDLATPWTFACFKAPGGASAYFHGGLSPQELIVPVITLTPKAKSQPVTAGILWSITPGSDKLSTRFFSVQIAGTGTGLFELQPPKVRVEIHREVSQFQRRSARRTALRTLLEM
jgi:hypothetical protein